MMRNPAEHIVVDERLLSIRRHLHAYPELGFHERETSAYIADQLRDHGIEASLNPVGSGVLAVIRGCADGHGEGPHIGLRADIDGLPVTEDSGVANASRNAGVMHACGHDIHMTGLLAAAFWLVEHRDRFNGSVTLVFQPAEETGEGAQALVDSGVVDDIDAMIGTHNNPDYAPGQIAVGTEPMMAGCVKFAVTLHAQGTHAGYPHMGTGPFEAMASMILALQTVVSRNETPFHPLVLSVTQVHGGDVWNVIPAKAGFIGTVRYFYPDDGAMARRRFHEIVERTAAAYDIGADIEWNDFAIPLVSDPELARAAMRDVAQYASLEPIKPSMAGEDFCEYAKKTRLLFAFIGSNGTPGHHGLHSPRFVALDDAIEPTAEFYVNAALRVLRELR